MLGRARIDADFISPGFDGAQPSNLYCPWPISDVLPGRSRSASRRFPLALLRALISKHIICFCVSTHPAKSVCTRRCGFYRADTRVLRMCRSTTPCEGRSRNRDKRGEPSQFLSSPLKGSSHLQSQTIRSGLCTRRPQTPPGFGSTVWVRPGPSHSAVSVAIAAFGDRRCLLNYWRHHCLPWS